MSETVENDGTVHAEGGAGLLPDNTKLLVSILSTNKDGSIIVRRPYAKQGPNASITALAVRLRVSEGNARGVGRNLFVDVPLARKFKTTTQKHPNGAPCRHFFEFFRALGFDVDATEGFTLPDDREIMGKSIEIVLGIEEANGEYEAKNIVKFINRPNGIPDNTALFRAADAEKANATAAATTPGATPTGSTPGWTPPQSTAQANGAPAGWAPPGAAEAAQPAAAVAADVPWTPDAADVAHAQALAATPVPDDASSLEPGLVKTF